MLRTAFIIIMYLNKKPHYFDSSSINSKESQHIMNVEIVN